MSELNPIYRSWLFVPGHKERMIIKSFILQADALIYDLEDAVPIAEKQSARDMLTSMLSSPPNPGAPARYIRLNHPSNDVLFKADLHCAMNVHPEGVVIPKVESADELRHVETMIKSAEAEAGIDYPTRIMFLIESPKGLLNAESIAVASDRSVGMSFGAEDFAREMGLPLVKTKEAKEQLYARSRIAIAAVVAGIQPIDIIWTALSDLGGLAQECAQGRRLGFTGKIAIHPDQLAPIHEEFSPTLEELEYANRVLSAYDEAVSNGTGAINFEGAFLEEPVVARARRLKELAERFPLEG